LLARIQCRNVTAVLLLRTKTLFIDGKPVKVYSFDGRTWFSKGRDMKEFNVRRRRIKSSIQNTLARWFRID